MASNSKNIGLILLAAGASERLGHPKQLLTYQDGTLLQHSLKTALNSKAKPTIAVLGAQANAIQKEVKDKDVYTEINMDWQEGMASSIRSGIKKLVEINPESEGVILMVCDQPFVTSTLLDDLISTYQKTGKQIVACSYDNTFGPPVLFHQSLFKELMQLKGDTGARSIVRAHTENVAVIPFTDGRYDIDTEEDYERIKSKENL